ncbi:MAG: hypothetical protein JWQ43_3375 [Glaciihabitans sp.]|nr:hypothetical protein [Glaciihabitans sp.]
MLRYTPTTPGGWLLAATPAAALLVQATAPAPAMPTALPSTLHTALNADDPIAAVLETLTAGGLLATPHFVLATWNAAGDIHLLVRGSATATISSAGAPPLVLDGASLATWRETTMTAVTAIQLGTTSATGTTGTTDSADMTSSADMTDSAVQGDAASLAAANIAGLPLTAGVVWASAATIDLADIDAENLTGTGTGTGTSTGTNTAGATAGPARAVAAGTVITDELPVTEPMPAEGTGASEHSASGEVDELDESTTFSNAAAVQPSTSAGQPSTPADSPDETDAQGKAVAQGEAETPITTVTPIVTLDEPDTSGYGHLFEETIVRTIEEAAVRPPEDEDEDEGGQLKEVGQPSDADQIDAAAEPDAVPSPSAVTENTGQYTDLGDTITEVAEDEVGAEAESAVEDDHPFLRGGARDNAAPGRQLYVEVSTGGREPLLSPILVGRAPSVTKVPSGLMPRLVTIPGDQDISRNHVQIALEGDTVVVTDLHSRNGTSVILPGKPPQKLRQGEPTAVLVDTVIDLGGGVTLSVRQDG